MYYFDNKFEKELSAAYPDYKIRVNRNVGRLSEEKTVSISVVDKFGNTIKVFDCATYEELGFYGSWSAMNNADSYISDEMIIYRMKIYDNIRRNWSIGIKIDSIIDRDAIYTFFAIDKSANINITIRDKYVQDVYMEHNSAVYMAIYYHIYGEKHHLRFPMSKLDDMMFLNPEILTDDFGVTVKINTDNVLYFRWYQLAYPDEHIKYVRSAYKTNKEVGEELLARAYLLEYIDNNSVVFRYTSFSDEQVKVYSEEENSNTHPVWAKYSIFTHKTTLSKKRTMLNSLSFALLYFGYWFRLENDSKYRGSKYERILHNIFRINEAPDDVSK